MILHTKIHTLCVLEVQEDNLHVQTVYTLDKLDVVHTD